MKSRYNTYDIVCVVTELQRLIGMRVNQIYDIDNRTFLIRLQRTEEKVVLLLESGNRFHTTRFEWPKNVAPSGFTMKLRKHLKNKRLESLTQLGTDRIVSLQFGTGEAAYHVIVELYDRGNILLCDHEMTILNVLRPHVEGEETRFAVREKYPQDRARSSQVDLEVVREALENCAPNSTLQTILNPITPFGPSLISHVLEKHSIQDRRLEGKAVEVVEEEGGEEKKGKKGGRKKKENNSGKIFSFQEDFPLLKLAIEEAERMVASAKETPSKGFIIQREEKRPGKGEEESFFVNLEYHPFPFVQNEGRPFREFDSFDTAVDEFYSTLEGQKIDIRAMQQEKEALKKLSNVRSDHAKRLEHLTKAQVEDRQKAELITRNQELVDNAIMAVQHALANQMSWTDIQELVKNARENGDPVAGQIQKLKLEVNAITMKLSDPYEMDEEEDDDDEEEDEDEDEKLKPLLVDIDLSLTAFANARKYYDQKRTAAKKEQKTIDASAKALKSAEKKTQQALKDVKTISNISKARKVFWFEKFYWFISSENFLVIGGRDQQQNELIVKRYMRPTDIYVHAEIHGASSVVIRNPSGGDVPPKTLLEAGTMAISYSVAWDAKVVTSAYWVRSDQVSKTAPTGEYLGTGSFMIRGKKNFLPPCHLILGLSFLFRLEESSVERHKGERRVRTFDGDEEADRLAVMIENEKLEAVVEEEEEIQLPDDGEEEEEEKEKEKEKSENEEEEEESRFPDTHIKIHQGKVEVKADPTLERLTSQDAVPAENVIFLGDDKPYVIQESHGKQKNKKKQQQQQQQKGRGNQNNSQSKEPEKETKASEGNSGLKRGQRGKLKKIKEKYRDQDDEERQLRMDILKSDGKSAKEKQQKAQEEEQAKIIRRTPQAPKPKEAGEEEDDTPAAADVDMLDSLTGQPLDEDELLFAIPVVAPYQALHNYKFKVKLTPGTGKRGKASKMAVLMFQKDKTCSPREKDLLKSVKDEAIARNIPGKVKLSAPQLQKYKK